MGTAQIMTPVWLEKRLVERRQLRIPFGKWVVAAVFLTLAMQVGSAWAQTANPYERIPQQTEERLRQMRGQDAEITRINNERALDVVLSTGTTQ